MKRVLLFFVLSFTFLVGHSISPAFAKEFSDVPKNHLNHVAINYLSDAGIISGNPDGTFQPEKFVNRVESLKLILAEAATKLNEDTTEATFKDTDPKQWYGKFLSTAKVLGIVSGNPDGTFDPNGRVKRAAFMKMILETNRFKKDKWAEQDLYKDVSKDQWFAAYMNYAGKSGLLMSDANGNLKPSAELTRGEVAEIIYLMRIILKGKDNQFLISQAEAQMGQIELFIGGKNVPAAKRASELANDLAQQALKNKPEDKVILGAAKVAKAYQLVIDAFIAGIQKNKDLARDFATKAKLKADEAVAANKDVSTIAKHIKERADEILGQLK
jgi:hypothetical protein